MPSLKGPKGRFIIGNLGQFRGDRLGFFTDCARTYGDVVPFRMGPRKCLLVSDPDFIEQVFITHAKQFIKHFGLRMYKPVLGNGLVTSEGDFWRRQRKLSAPAFQPSRLAAYARVMQDATERMLQSWNDGVRDVHGDMTHLTLEIACKTLFGVDASADAQVVGDTLNVAMKVIGERMRRVIRAPLWFPTSANRRLNRSMRTLDDIVARMIHQGRAAPNEDRADLLSILLRQQDDDGSAMTDRQLLDEARTLFVAGHETTALTLTYALYLLALHPEIQAEVQSAVDVALGEKPPCHADLHRLRAVRNVVYESLRLYPPADVLGREALGDITIKGVPIAKGMNIFASTWVLHRDRRFFAEPEKFDPGRWTDEFEKSLPRFAYFPFGGGPRFCIGQSFAITEATLALAAIVQRASFKIAAGFRLELWPAITLRPLNGVKLVVGLRGSALASTVGAGVGAFDSVTQASDRGENY
ncbi:MAG TPA: cytochrome P450 [Tepidisphaeraceae bacterium]|jgi:cytochrome P450|nr:cytochrome P450 [Tepidisphaeraceae bacterium]